MEGASFKYSSTSTKHKIDVTFYISVCDMTSLGCSSSTSGIKRVLVSQEATVFDLNFIRVGLKSYSLISATSGLYGSIYGSLNSAVSTTSHSVVSTTGADTFGTPSLKDRPSRCARRGLVGDGTAHHQEKESPMAFQKITRLFTLLSLGGRYSAFQELMCPTAEEGITICAAHAAEIGKLRPPAAQRMNNIRTEVPTKLTMELF
ncbi:hypothetical protein HUJ04_004175 [Dendroctonus ponderosae]|nr:hypothetical protein HUJ04_004175 [Dendroctonus ponderosae]